MIDSLIYHDSGFQGDICHCDYCKVEYEFLLNIKNRHSESEIDGSIEIMKI